MKNRYPKSGRMLLPSSEAAAVRGLTMIISIAWICSYAALGAQAQQCSGSFSASCSGGILVGSILSISCLDENQNYRDSSLDLDQHIVNKDGVLACSSDAGSFSLTCYTVSLFGSSQLSASCLDSSSTLLSTSLDLDTCVQNRNGHLQWACVS